jgi:aminoglycoside phosphotransferase family enzyme
VRERVIDPLPRRYDSSVRAAISCVTLSERRTRGYSEDNATTGSTRLARLAGRYAANRVGAPRSAMIRDAHTDLAPALD